MINMNRPENFGADRNYSSGVSELNEQELDQVSGGGATIFGYSLGQVADAVVAVAKYVAKHV
jgi:lactobin A/cerein 7B family class IIb bacteriocin